MYDETITVFNRYETQLGTYMWFPHVLRNVYLIVDKAANRRKTGLENADTANLHIKYQMNDKKIMIGNLQYMDPKEWEMQPNDMYEKTITFSEGEDFFIKGEYPETPVDDNDYYKGSMNGFSDYINRNYDHVYSITSVGRYTLIPHFEIGGV